MIFLYYLYTTRPHDTRSSLVVELSNEVMLQIISYHVLFTGFRYDFKRWVVDYDQAIENEDTLNFDVKLGQSMIALIVLLQISNLIVILMSTIKDIKWKLHLKMLKRA